MAAINDPRVRSGAHLLRVGGVAIVVLALLAVGCTGSDEGSTPTADTDDAAVQGTERTDEPEAGEAEVIWDERSPMGVEWTLADSRQDWRPPYWGNVIAHGDQVAVEMTESSNENNEPEQASWVEVSDDGITWTPHGGPLPIGIGYLVSDGDRLAVATNPGISVSGPDGEWTLALDDGLAQRAIVGPAGMITVGWKAGDDGDKQFAVWKLEGDELVEVETNGIDPELQEDTALYSGGMPQGYLVRESEFVGDGYQSTDWFSADGTTWTPAKGPNPAGNFFMSTSAGWTDTTIAQTDGGLWITEDGESWSKLPIGSKSGPVYGGSAGFALPTDTALAQDSEILLSPDGRRWLEVNAPPRPPEIDPPAPDTGWAYGQAFVHDGNLVVLDTYGKHGGVGWLGNTTTHIWTTPAIDWESATG